MAENYGEVRDVLEKSNPEGMEQIRAYVRKASKSLDLNPQELDETIRLFKYVIENQRNYAEVRARLQREFDAKLPERFDPVYFGMGLVVLQVMQSGSKFAQGGIAQLAQELQNKGRYGDTILAHISPEEAKLLKSLGGSGTINPETGLPEFFLKWIASKISDAVESIGNIVGDIVEGVGDAVEDIVESPVGRVLATAALTAVGAPYLAGFGISTAGTAAIVSGGLTAATGGDLGDIAKSAALAFASSELMQSVAGPDVKWMDQVSPSQLEAIGTGNLPGDFSWMDAVTPSQLAAAGVREFVPQLTESLFQGYDFSQPLLPPSLDAYEFMGPPAPFRPILPEAYEFVGPTFEPTGPSPVAEALPEITMEPVTSDIPPGVTPPAPELPPIEVTPLSGEVPTDLSTDELLETALSGEVAAPTEPFDITDVVPATETLPEFSPEDMVPPSALPQPEAPSALDAGMGAYPEPAPIGDPYMANELAGAPPSGAPPMTPEQVAAAAAAGGAGDPYIASELAGSAPDTWDPSFMKGLAALAATPLGKAALTVGGSALLNKLLAPDTSGKAGTGPQGWSGTIPKYEAVRERVPFTDTLRRPGEYGRRYFSDTAYVPMQTGEGSVESNIANIAAAKELARQQASGLASIPTRPVVEPPVLKYMSTAPSLPPRAAPAVGLPSLPTYENEPRLSFGLPSAPVEETFTPERRRAISMQNALAARGPGLAAGGIAQGRYLNGATDGMEDKVPAHIDGKQPARLSHGEFVIPADVVSHLGNGNSQAGAKRLYDMMDRIRQARTGTTKQGKQIQPDKYLPR